MRKRNMTPFFWFGVALGAVTGVTAGLLLAPAKGEKIRRLLRKEIKKGAAKVGEVGDSAAEIGRRMHLA
jgi:gas vesicle protein